MIYKPGDIVKDEFWWDKHYILILGFKRKNSKMEDYSVYNLDLGKIENFSIYPQDSKKIEISELWKG